MNLLLLLLLLSGGCGIVQANDNFSSLDDIDMDDEISKPNSNQVDSGGGNDGQQALKRAMAAAMRKPGAYSRLGQVLPIVRLMSPAQRLALASLVMSQVVASPEEPLPPIDAQSKNMTANLMLPISMDIATMFRGLGRPGAAKAEDFVSQLHPGVKRVRPDRGQGPGINRRNAQLHPDDVLVDSTPKTEKYVAKEVTSDCLHETNTFCTSTDNYPEKEIIESIRNSKNIDLTALTEDSKILPSDVSFASADKLNMMERRLSDDTDIKAGEAMGSMCKSKVELARPKRARATSGLWKYIVNTADYTQTLRMEICADTGNRCLFLPENIDSECVQIYNYHRLLTWEESSGLTMDIFKVPTCCSCRVRGYGGLMLNSLHQKTDQSNSIVQQPEESRIKPIRGIGTGNVRRPPQVKHRGPPLPLENERPPYPSNYPPYENPLRRFTRNNSAVEHYNERPSPNQRHPTLPAESLEAAGSTIKKTQAPLPNRPQNKGPQRPKRVNYSYHPILEFFRPGRVETRKTAPWLPERSPALVASPAFNRQAVLNAASVAAH